MMACWQRIDSYSNIGHPFDFKRVLFDFGQSGTIYYARAAGVSPIGTLRVRVGRYVSGYPEPDLTDLPGPNIFSVDEWVGSQVILGTSLQGFAVDDSGEEPVFYLGFIVGPSVPGGPSHTRLVKYSAAGTIINEITISDAEQSIRINGLVLLGGGDQLFATTYSQYPDHPEDSFSWHWRIPADLDNYQPLYLWDHATGDENNFIQATFTKDRWIWMFAPINGSSYEDGLQVTLYEPDWSFHDIYAAEWIPEGTQGSEVSIWLDCNANDLIVLWDPPEGDPTARRYSFQSALDWNPTELVIMDHEYCKPLYENGARAVDRVIPSWDGKYLMSQTRGFQLNYTNMGLWSCEVEGHRPLRQRQRNDRFNAPRSNPHNNTPSSRQFSLRSSPGSNTYLRDRELCGC